MSGAGPQEARRRLAAAVRALGHRSLASDPGEESLVELAALGYLLTVHGIVAYTGELNVRYLAGTPIGVPLTFRSRIVDRDGRRTTIAGRAVAAAEVVATASGVFVETPADQLGELDGVVPDHRSAP